MASKYDKEIICPDCQQSRIVSYKMVWNIKAGKNSGRCSRCAGKVFAATSPNFKLDKQESAWNKGLKGFSAGHPAYINKQGADNPQWKGDDVGYVGLHVWVARHKGRPKMCQQCGLDDPKRKYEWANISHEYKRDLEDWARLCVSCHSYYDRGKLELTI